MVHSSTSAAPQSHGNEAQKAANRRTCDSRVWIVLEANRREDCWPAHPASMSSNNCSAGRSTEHVARPQRDHRAMPTIVPRRHAATLH